ncbi:rhomboid family intramembrane serine protease [bacterium LRH843]|nr:rhomboid family intramembrane serine protease [bacterium LRH843]
MFIRNESFYTFRRNYPVVTTIVAIHLVLFVWMNFLPAGELIQIFGIGYNLLVADGEYWRLITPIFLHLGFGHLIFNSFSLIIFGPALEQMLGRIRFIFVYFITGIIANVATFYIGGLTYPAHLGASGAIFGLLGIYIYLVIYRKDLIDQANAQLVMTIIAIGLVMTFVNSNINIFAHLFGLIAGAALAPIILIGIKPYYKRQIVQSKQDIVFDPNRWNKRKINKKRIQLIVWTIFLILVIIGILARLF